MLSQRSARLYCRKKVAKKLQVEKIGKKTKSSEDYVKSTVTWNFMLTYIFALQRFNSALKHSWLASTENIVNSSANGKKIN